MWLECSHVNGLRILLVKTCVLCTMAAGKESSGVLEDLHEKMVTLKHTTTESSVIATRLVGGSIET